MRRVLWPVLVLGLIGASLDAKAAVPEISDIMMGASIGVVCGLVVGGIAYNRSRAAARGTYLIAGSVVAWIVTAITLPASIGGFNGMDESTARIIGIGITVACLVGVVAGGLAFRKSA